MVGELVSSCRTIVSEETPSTKQDCDAAKRSARVLAPDRNDTPYRAQWFLVRDEDAIGRDETTAPQGERANKRKIHLQDARVARLAKCCLKQKMGYDQHANCIFKIGVLN